MNESSKIQIRSIKLANSVRLLRFTHPKSSVTLERKLDPTQPVAGQKAELAKIFQAALTEAKLTCS